MSAASRPVRSGNIQRNAEVARRCLLGFLILLAHAALIYMLRGGLLVRPTVEESATFPLAVRILEGSPATLSLEIPPPGISKIDFRFAAPVLPEVLVEPTPSEGTSHFETAKLDSSHPVAKFVVLKIDHRRAPSSITLLVEVLADGSVGQVEVKASAGAELDAAAASYVRKLRWTPANVGGKPVAMKVLYSLGLS